MKFIGLISGGKDSILSIMKLIESGHELVALANLFPGQPGSELDSYMYQCVGSELVNLIGECIGKPLYRREIKGKPFLQKLEYQSTDGDEVEDLYQLILDIKGQFPNAEGLSSGAIESTYQKNRVESVCNRLGLISLSPLWKRNPKELLEDFEKYEIKAILVRICSEGLDEGDLGRSINDMKNKLLHCSIKYGTHCCGEGGEFETIVLDCPIYRKKIIIDEAEVIIEMKNPLQIRARLRFNKAHLIDKENISDVN